MSLSEHDLAVWMQIQYFKMLRGELTTEQTKMLKALPNFKGYRNKYKRKHGRDFERLVKNCTDSTRDMLSDMGFSEDDINEHL